MCIRDSARTQPADPAPIIIKSNCFTLASLDVAGLYCVFMLQKWDSNTALVAIEINGFSLFIRALKLYLKRALFVARWDKRFEKREAAPGLSQSRAFINADQMIWFCNLNGVFLFRRVLAYLGVAHRYFLQVCFGQYWTFWNRVSWRIKR